MGVQLELTQELVDRLSFKKRLIDVDPNGKPVYQSTPKNVTDWDIRDGGKKGEPGLILRVTPTSLSWYVRRFLTKKTGSVRRSIARARKADDSTDEVLSLADARKVAREWLVLMEKGIDPYDVRKKHQATTQHLAEERRLTMGVAFGEFVEFKRKFKIGLDGVPIVVGIGKRRVVDAKLRDPSTEDRLKVARWMEGSPMWSTPVKTLSRDEVEASLTPLLRRSAGLRAPVRWGPKSVSKGTLDKIYRHLDGAWWRAVKALEMKVTRDDSPFQKWRIEHDSDWPADRRVDTALDTKSDAHRTWLRALYDMQQEAHDPAVFAKRVSVSHKGIKPHVASMVDWYFCLILWGTRATETQLMEWPQVDFEKHLIWLTGDTTKSGELDVVPLTPFATTILKERQRINMLWRPDDPGKYVFPSREHGRPISSPRGVLTALEERTGIKLKAHDLRRSLAREIGTDKDMVETARLLVAGAALHHGAGKGGSRVTAVTRRYLEDKAETLRPLFQQRENRIREILGLAVEKKPDTDLNVDALLKRLREDPSLLQQIMAAALNPR
ncbi:MAG: hypothetical protein RSP_04630 [Rhodanobacter sp.]